jgi:effector-binding domain-containing protein
MITEPKIEYRREIYYAAVRAQVPIPFGKVLAPLWDEVRAWLTSKGMAPSGAPFIRYLTTDMARKLDIEVGFPVATALPGNDRITTGVFPAGRYAILVYTGPYKGKGLVKATSALLDWAKENNIVWKTSTKDGVEWWEGRIEYYITDPAVELDSKKWRTELAFLVAES